MNSEEYIKIKRKLKKHNLFTNIRFCIVTNTSINVNIYDVINIKGVLI